MNGFEKVICEKIQGINSHITVSAPHQKLAVNELTTYITKKFGSEIQGMSAGSVHQILIDHDDTQSVLYLKAIDPETVNKVSCIEQKITLPPSKPGTIKTLLASNQIIIGYKAAQSIGLTVGATVTLLIPEAASKKKIALTKESAEISGIFNVGFDEYDSNVAYCSLDFFRELFDSQEKTETADFLFINVKPTDSFWTQKFYNLIPWYTYNPTELFVQKLRKELPNLTISSWQELSPALVDSLKLEKYIMFLILALITLVASLNMISLLFMQIQSKRKDIAILKAMGIDGTTLSRIFLKMGLFITMFGSLLGLLLAGIIGYILENYPYIKIPDVYFVSYLPARVEPELFVGVFLVTLLLGFIATWVPARRALKINVTEVLRHE